MEIIDGVGIDRTYLFRGGIDETNDIVVRYDKPFHLLRKRAACKSLTNLFWHIFSGFTYYKYSLIDDETGDEIAYTHISKDLPHLEFTHRFGGGYHIGPGYTNPKYRCLGFHPYILNKVIEDVIRRHPNTYIYICVSQDNVASIKGIEKTGSNFAGLMQHREFQYKLIEGTETFPIVNNPRKVWSKLFGFVSTLKTAL